MIKTERQLKLEELEKVIEKLKEPSERTGLYSSEKPKDECERFGFPQELWSIME